jgi:hypothetical protein
LLFHSPGVPPIRANADALERSHAMSRLDFLNQGSTPFDGFLYAEVGEDKGGNTVSVLSALARLGLDPWNEAADLSDLSDDGARSRLGGLLSRLTDVPSLDQGVIIPRLIDLLPRSSGRRTGATAILPQGAGALGFGPILAGLLLVLVLVQTFLLGSG